MLGDHGGSDNFCDDVRPGTYKAILKQTKIKEVFASH